MKLNYVQGASRPQKFGGRKIEPVPKGVYRLAITDVETKTPKAGGADYLSVSFEVETGQYLGRKVWDNFSVNHANADVREFSRFRFDELAQAAGAFPVSDTDELIGRVVAAKIDVEESDDFPSRNQVKRYVVPKAKSAAPTAPAASPKAAKADASLDDDIPF
jgi:hypothetical protein